MLSQLRFFTLTALFACASQGAPIYSGSFDSGTDGWSIGEFFSSPSSPASGFIPTGGVSGGYLETTDVYGYNAFRAPASWLGNQIQLFGTNLHFFQRAEDTDNFVSPLIVLAGSGMFLQYRAAPPGTDWTEYDVSFIAGEWEVGNGSGEAGRLATNDEIREVLSSLDWLAINADWKTGADRIGLDGVAIETARDPGPVTHTPEPASLPAVAGLGALATAVWRRRRKR